MTGMYIIVCVQPGKCDNILRVRRRRHLPDSSGLPEARLQAMPCAARGHLSVYLMRTECSPMIDSIIAFSVSDGLTLYSSFRAISLLVRS
jgi:hypothetical protein